MKNISKHYPWIVVALLWFVALLNYMDRQMLSTMQFAMKVDITELNKAESFGALMAVFLWIYGFVSPFAGIIADQISRKKLIIGSLFVWSAVTFLMGFANTFSQLYWLRAFMGVSEALYIPSALSLIADWHGEKTRSLAIGIHMTGIYVGQAAGGFGASIADHLSWHLTFHWFGIIGILYAIVLILCLKDYPKPNQTSKISPQKRMKTGEIFQGLKAVLSTWSFWIILFYFASPGIPGWAVMNWLPTLFSENLQIPMSSAGPISTTTIAIFSFLGVIIGGILSDKWVQRNIKGRIYTSAIGVTFTIPALLLMGLGHGLINDICAGAMFGIGFGMFDANNMPILCQVIPSRYRATAYGFMNMVGVFSGAMITQVLGKLTDRGNLGEGFAVLTIIVFIALILLLTCLHPTIDEVK